MNNYQYIVDMMQRNDPNGEYDLDGIKAYPFVYLDILQMWYHELKDIGERIPAWLPMCIQWLDKATV